MTPLEFYNNQADKAAEEAENTSLENVRQRCLRAAGAWRAMAAKLEYSAALKDGRSGN